MDWIGFTFIGVILLGLLSPFIVASIIERKNRKMHEEWKQHEYDIEWN